MAAPTVLAMSTEQLPAVDELTERELAMLALERSWWKSTGRKETAIREQFGCSPTAYYLELNALIDRPAALAADPLLVRRLHRLRDARRAQRDPRRTRC